MNRAGDGSIGRWRRRGTAVDRRGLRLARPEEDRPQLGSPAGVGGQGVGVAARAPGKDLTPMVEIFFVPEFFHSVGIIICDF